MNAPPPSRSKVPLILAIGALALGLSCCGVGGCLALAAAASADTAPAADPSNVAEPESAPPAAPPGESAARARYRCNATGWVMVCMPGGSCMNTLMSAQGLGTTEATAFQMAKQSCEGQIIARGGTPICTVACQEL